MDLFTYGQTCKRERTKPPILNGCGVDFLDIPRSV